MTLDSSPVLSFDSLRSESAHFHPDRDVGEAQLAWDYRSESHPELGLDSSKDGPVVRSCKVTMEQPDAVLPGALAATGRNRAVPVSQSPIEDRNQTGALRVQHLRKDREPRVSVEMLREASYLFDKVPVGIGEIDATRNRP